VKKGSAWISALPFLNVDDYVFAYANVIYDTTVVVSTDFMAAIPSKLGQAKATDKASDTLYSGDGGIGIWSNVAEAEARAASRASAASTTVRASEPTA
jgi:hypothetical protein